MATDLSIIIPVYNGATFIGESVQRIHNVLAKSNNITFQIVVVNDGSSDRTVDVLKGLSLPNVITVDCPENRGKFAAIRTGMNVAHGRCRIFTDADIPYDEDAFLYLVHLVNERGLHLVVGDRTLMDSVYAERLSPLRAAVTQLFTTFVRLIVVSGLHDTQCGLKAVRGDVAEHLFPLLRDNGFSGDVELLYIALKYNLEIKRIPVRLRRSGDSTVKVFRHGFLMLRRILTLRIAWKRGDYESAALRQIAQQRYWECPEAEASDSAEIRQNVTCQAEPGIF